MCYLYYFSGPFSLGQIRGLGSCLGIHYLTLNHWLTWLTLLERNWIRGVGRPIDGETYGQLYGSHWYTCPQARGWLIRRVFVWDRRDDQASQDLTWRLNFPRSDVIFGDVCMRDLTCIDEGFFGAIWWGLLDLGRSNDWDGCDASSLGTINSGHNSVEALLYCYDFLLRHPNILRPTELILRPPKG